MNKTKKRICLLLTIVMILSLALPALAAPKIDKKVSLKKNKIFTVYAVKGQKVQLKAAAGLKWTSSKKKVATVKKSGKNGIVTTKKKGTTTIKATKGKTKYTCKLIVETPKISRTNASIAVGESIQMKVSGTKQGVKWSSSNTKVAKVTIAGMVTGKGQGRAVITADIGGMKYYCKVTVGQDAPVPTNAPEPTIMPKPTPAPEPTNTPDPTEVPLPTDVPIPTNTPIPPIPTNKPEPTPTFTPTLVPTASPTATPTPEPTATPTLTPKPSVIPIYNADDFYAIDGSDGNYYFANDIDIRGRTDQIEAFNGILDGKNCKLLIDRPSDPGFYNGIIAKNNGIIKNINIHYDVNGYYSKLSFIYLNYGHVENVHAKGTINISSNKEGDTVYITPLVFSNSQSEPTNKTCSVVHCSNEIDIIVNSVYKNELGYDIPNSVSVYGILYSGGGSCEKCWTTGTLTVPSGTPGNRIGIGGCGTCNNCLYAGSGYVCGISVYGFNKLYDCVVIGKYEWATDYSKFASEWSLLKDLYYLKPFAEHLSETQDNEKTRAHALDENQIADIAFYPTLDFTNIWKMTDEGPRLR